VIMGSEASKPVQPPEDWERNGDQFRIISPMSDVSNPSEIHRAYHHERRPEPKIVDPNRTPSRTVTKAVASSNPHSEIPAPSSFYFPERMSRRDEEKQGKENQNGLQRMIKKSKKVMAGCFVNEHEGQADMVNLQAVDVKKMRSSKTGTRGARTNQSRSNVYISDVNGYKPDLVIKKNMSKIEEEESNNSSKNSNPVNEVAHGISEMALHQEDAYFDRLMGGSNGEVHASPFVQNTALRNMPSTLDNGEWDQQASAFESPVSDLFVDLKPKSAAIMQNENKPRNKISSRPRESSSSRSNRTSLSSIVQVSSRIGLTAAAGQTTAPRMSTVTAESKGSRSDEESSAMSYGVRRVKVDNVQSAFRIPQEPLKQVATLGKQSRSSYGSRSRRSSQGTRVSKLECLFRPVLPALSADDATASSFDPYEIKVTESAPSQLEGNHRHLDVRTDQDPKSNQLALISPSMLSIDSQTHQSPSMVKTLLSHQAVNNGEFLFSSDYGPVSKKMPHSNRDSAMFSISTLGARSRLSHRSAKAVPIPVKQSQSVTSQDSSKTSDRHVRFSNDTKPKSVDIPMIESKMSDLSDLGDLGDNTSEQEIRSSFMNLPIPEEDDAHSPEEDRVRWAYSAKDGTSSVTPYVKGKSMLEVTNSPYVRYQAAKDKWESQEIEEVDLAENLKDRGSGRLSTESARSNRSGGSIPKESFIENDEQETPESSETQVHWSYSSNGVTPHLSKGKSAENVTKSPMNRFKQAKTKFGTIKDLPAKSPRAVKTKRKGAGGVVTARIEALDRKVIVNRRFKRKLRDAKKSLNPRRFQVVNASYVRSQKLNGYAPTRVDLDKLNQMGAAKFNKIPNFDEDDYDDMSSIESSVFMMEDRPQSMAVNNQYPNDDFFPNAEAFERYEEKSVDNSTKRLSTASSAVSTVLQEKRFNHHRVSESSHSTSASSGLSRVKKQVFENRHSLSSTGDSTTLSSIIGKENETYLLFRSAPNTVKPTEQKLITLPESLNSSPTQKTPTQARKWRSLAAAAQEKDASKKAFADWKQRHGTKKLAGYAN
jgi:hypothetical protein